MNNLIKILIVLLVLPTLSYCKKVNHLKIELLHLTLISENNKLKNDTLDLSLIKCYFMKGYLSGNINDYHQADTIVSIIMNNQDFFIGLSFKDIESVIGNICDRGSSGYSYRMARWDMREPIIKVILFFQFKNGKVTSIHAPYINECCSNDIGKKTIWQRLIPRKNQVWSRPLK